MDDVLSNCVGRSCFTTKEYCDWASRDVASFDVKVFVDHIQSVHLLAFVLVETFDLDVKDRIGIELIGMAYKAKSHQETRNPDGSFNFLITTTTDGKTLKYENLSADVASQMRKEIKESKNGDDYSVFEQVTNQQNESLQWLTQQLRREYSIPESEVFAHPTVSRKTGSEALTARWR